jgi:O-antigen ligase
MVLLADSRTAYAALVLGLAVLVVLPRWLGGARVSRGARLAAAVLGLLAAVRVLVEAAADPTGAVTATGRVTMWPDFLSLWPQSPWTGVGDAGVAEAIADGRLAPWATQGHDVYIDALVRYGVIGLALVMVVVVSAVIIAVTGARQGNAVSLAIIAMIAAVSLTEASFHWLFPTVSFSVLLTGVLLSPRSTSPITAAPPAAEV